VLFRSGAAGRLAHARRNLTPVDKDAPSEAAAADGEKGD